MISDERHTMRMLKREGNNTVVSRWKEGKELFELIKRSSENERDRERKEEAENKPQVEQLTCSLT